MTRMPRIVSILAFLAVVFGVWVVEPRWIVGVLGLIVLYHLVTNGPTAVALIDQADAGLRAIIAPRSSSIGAGGGRAKP